jgi:transmembrane sensor
MNSSAPHTQTLQDRIREEAALWFAKLTSPLRSAETEHQFQQWLNANPAHAPAYERCKSVWLLSNDLLTDANIQRELALAKQGLHGSATAQHGRWSKFAQYAAIFFIAVGLFFVGSQMPSNEYSTQIGEQRLIKLADGSTAMLNTNTVLQVDISSTHRKIQLLQGEAYFDVAHDSARPFEVLAVGSIVRALGTEFNVAISDREIAVSVTAGRVAVETQNPQQQRQIIAEINPGEAVKYNKDGPPPQIQAANLNRIAAWQARKIYFKADRLQDAVKEYNRYIEQPMQILDEELQDQLITGIFNIGDLDSFAFSLEQALDAQVIKEKNRILIVKKVAHAKPQG